MDIIILVIIVHEAHEGISAKGCTPPSVVPTRGQTITRPAGEHAQWRSRRVRPVAYPITDPPPLLGFFSGLTF